MFDKYFIKNNFEQFILKISYFLHTILKHFYVLLV